MALIASSELYAAEPTHSNSVIASANALLAIDQHRATVIDRIVGQWGEPLAASGAGLSATQLRTMLSGLRADHLLAASLAGSLTGLRDVLAQSLTVPTAAKALYQTKALGDSTDDLVYTPVTPCRLFDSRLSQGGQGTPQLNIRRTYGAISPVANQGGPGGCAAASGATVALIQIGTLTPNGNGLLQGGAQGAGSFPNALVLYQPGDQYGTAVAMPLNPANGQFDLVEQSARADLYGDLLGYFKRPSNYGGTHTITGQYATDSGGYQNAATGDASTVGGGYINTATGTYSTVVGGYANAASAGSSAVGGGIANAASGNSSTVAGGSANTASGDKSTVAGGGSNLAGGDYSFVAGYRAKAYVNGSFVWSDGTDADFSSGLPNEFLVGATGGIGMYTAKNYTTGCHINTGGGSWSCTSSRDVKRDFETVDVEEVLHKVSDLPMLKWRFMNEHAAIRHLGPMAQDFRAAFDLGTDDRTIATVDENGVALAAIQGLHKVAQQKDAHIAELERRLTQLERIIEALMAKQ
jgi:hypothetical protein